MPDRLHDVVVYGATPAGIAAALAAARGGCTVLLVEPTATLGGLVTSGLSHTDFRTFESLSGTYLRFTQRVLAYYRKAYGRDSAQARDCMRGTQAEPKVNLLVFEEMLAEAPSITVWREANLAGVETLASGDTRRIATVRLETTGKAARVVAAKAFVDASYEGDLMAAAGVPFRVGREGREEHGESLAPEQPDGQLQGYNFRLIATRKSQNRVPVQRPDGYQREDYVAVIPLLLNGRLKGVFGYPNDFIYKAQIPTLPNGKYDINDVSHSAVRLSLPGENLRWPKGDIAARREIFENHLRWNTGLLWFLQHDPTVPAKFQQEALGWGWCKDEFVSTAHLPPQLYVREARRMQGQRIFAQGDSAHAPGDARAVLHRDSVAAGDYGNNCHGTDHEGPRIGGKHTGEFYHPVPPYQIPYPTLLPREVTNLLVPVAASASHVGFCALRLEPIWTSLGDAAGTAAALAVRAEAAVQAVPVSALQVQLRKDGAATIYVSDVPPGHPDFAAVQWWGIAGGLHGLTPTPDAQHLRGKNIVGQYFEAFPHHQAALNRRLENATRERWRALASSLLPDISGLPKTGTRGAWIRAAFKELMNPG
ncbi:MAG: FAD-dependent oxidoreductase [Bryobacterales bacterium]|nr:FAD-dependent oxidoreductase [Bryobacterales bacterium]